MKAEFSLDLANPEQVTRAVAPSLRTDDAVTYTTDTTNDTVTVTVDTDDLGTLRGATNTVLMLSKLSNRIFED